ncbi:hypothetical protein PHMEG_000710 [Phytophthora megakarya]|uniref:VWFA domain-containing protein n=1 Tax=Phytophthora megakarya TaxID=4795 RepID=A0A225X3M7_9STRA|nr:hypothetical protein PHMEG_000710 [Phytophthora megakarya]
MRYHLGANRELISSNCFRLMSLVPEVQNDVEVVKPVLEELEVMRLSCSLGMLSSVNPNDFEMELLEAQEFDDDFVLFLRKEVLGAANKCDSDGVKVISLFGKQDGVKHELERLNCWSEEMENNLNSEDQGIYCVTLQNDEAAEDALVLFGWIQDGLFRKSKLRDTPTYVLRFLTCLSTDMVCCLSPDDVELLERTVTSMNSNKLDAWKSFSVAFHVERQEEQKDAVQCENMSSIKLPTNATAVRLLKGSYPAYSVLEPAAATKWKEQTKQSFNNITEFSTWLINESKQRNLRLEFGPTDPSHFREVLLKATDQWPTAQLKDIDEMLDRSLQSSDEQTKDRVQAQIEEHRATLLGYIDNLFDLDVLIKASKTEPAFVKLNAYVQQVQSDRSIWSQVDPETKVVLTLPLRLKKLVRTWASTFRYHLERTSDATNAETDLVKLMHEVTVSEKNDTTGDNLFGRTLKTFGNLLSWDPDSELLSDEFRERMASPLYEAQQVWFETVENVLTVVEKVLQVRWSNEAQTSLREVCKTDEYNCVSEAFNKLLSYWCNQHDDGLMTTLRPRIRPSTIYCDIQKEHWKPATDQMKITKLTQNDNGFFDTVELGTHRLEPDAKLLTAFTIKNHCVVLVTTSPKGTLVERVNFPMNSRWWGEKIGKVSFTRAFGRVASLCDFDVVERVIAFVEEGGRVVLYRFNETISSLEIYKRVELSLRTSLTLPVKNVLLVDGSLYATDVNGAIQSVTLKNQQVSREEQIIPSDSRGTINSLFATADNMVLGFVATLDDKDSTKDTTEVLAVAINEDKKKICVLRLMVTVRSESFRIRHSKENSVNGSRSESGSESDEVEHWLRAFFHINAILTKSVEDRCRCFFQAMMRDLRKLNKPLSGMDFARDLVFVTESNAGIADVATQSVRSFLQQLITFVPIQICRAEANSLTVMTNGKDTPMNTQSQNLQAVDIARSIRFGLLSPLLESWQGRCIVITSMGKQSTGKSYLLNHLTGSSFAIAGARCTDGAWMSIRILPKNILLIVLDFEGLGSFERTEQEDVFLSVLNASISMFTIFRMEMRFDKEIDDLFARFQKGVTLIKGDSSLFRGKLYMSVKDVNPNDQKGVLDEFVAKFQTLVGTNKDSNFLLDLYSGQLDINCSPPLGTINYYQSLMHAQNFIENDLCCAETTGFRSGKTFLNCIRLVLAKIAILDWTSLDEGAKQFQLSEVSSKLSGLLRTGCIIPQEYVTRKEDIAAYLKEDIVLTGNGKVIDVNLETMIVENPVLGEKWKALDEFLDLDGLSDWAIDLGFDCCSTSDDAIPEIHEAIKQILRLFLRRNMSIRGGKVSREIVTDFDAFLAFIVRRRKARISIWVKQMLGGRLPEEWKAMEQQFLVMTVEETTFVVAAANIARAVNISEKLLLVSRNQGTKENVSVSMEITLDVAVAFSLEHSDEKNSNTFNAASEVPVVHMCGNGHECQAMCEEDGICQVNVYLKQSSKTFTGARGSFQFTFQEMNGSRKKCTKLLPPGQKMHQGSHTCICEERDEDDGGDDQTIHYCNVRCPCCSYFCKKKFGHFGSHTTSHGNMRNTYFLSDAEEIDIEERKYKAGELGIAEMCNLYCSKMGREHVHYLECEQGSKANCVYSGSTADQRRHCTRSLEPKPDKETDEVLHEQFWKTLGWEDPCTSKMELELFGKCGYKCNAPDHDDKPSYCILPAWHKPEPKPRSGFDGFTYVSGHKFECSHVASGGKMHHVFVLDCSGSMSGRPWNDLMAAWKEYIYNRIADGASLDLVSVVTFDNYAQIVYEAQNITTMTNANVQYRGGGTNYAAGLRAASEILSRVNFDAYKPAVVFFSDGHPCDPLQGGQLAAHIRDCYEKNGLQAFAVGFGSINLSMLERVAEKMGGTYHHVLTGNELKATFFSISASLSTRAGLALAKPDHERNCVICGQDLASGETVKLGGCGHELHKVCVDVLVRNAQQDGERARCPSQLTYALIGHDGKSCKQRAFLDAAAQGDVAGVDVWLQTGGDVNVTMGEGWTALLYAVANSRMAIVQRLLREENVDLNATTILGSSALTLALTRKSNTLTTLLLSSGASRSTISIELWRDLEAASWLRDELRRMLSPNCAVVWSPTLHRQFPAVDREKCRLVVNANELALRQREKLATRGMSSSSWGWAREAMQQFWSFATALTGSISADEHLVRWRYLAPPLVCHIIEFAVFLW